MRASRKYENLWVFKWRLYTKMWTVPHLKPGDLGEWIRLRGKGNAWRMIAIRTIHLTIEVHCYCFFIAFLLLLVNLIFFKWVKQHSIWRTNIENRFCKREIQLNDNIKRINNLLNTRNALKHHKYFSQSIIQIIYI